MNYLTVSMLASHYGVRHQSIRRWCRNGNLEEHHRTIGNHRRFEEPKKTDGQIIGYVRVSSADQKSDLKIQEQALNEKARLQNITINSTITDVGSGMNYKKRGFKQLMNMLLTNRIKHLVIMQKDRLLRFGSEIIFIICKLFNVEVTILEPSPANSPTEQLCMDLIEIMTVFTNKIYGMRSNSNKKVLLQAGNMANAQL